MKMDVYEMSASSSSSSSIGYLSADSSSSSSNSVSSNMLEEEHHQDDTASNGSMFELSDLLSQLPIKRGLSKYYNGKSDSFKNLITVRSLEDIPKNRSQRSSLYKMKKNKRRKDKGRSAGLLSDQSQNSKHDKLYYTTPKSKISKSNNNNKGSTRGSVLMNTWSGRRSGFTNSSSDGFLHI